MPLTRLLTKFHYKHYNKYFLPFYHMAQNYTVKHYDFDVFMIQITNCAAWLHLLVKLHYLVVALTINLKYSTSQSHITFCCIFNS